MHFRDELGHTPLSIEEDTFGSATGVRSAPEHTAVCQS
jgi:hypothetical protein